MLIVFIYPIVYPTASYALTSGPQQPEATQFMPIGSDNMVDLFTGDFSYNIPLLDVGGYPINISYQAGIGMDQEASWVGLGWSLNPGALNRNMRGLPDDFNGDKVVKQIHRKANQSWGITAGANFELFGKEVETKTVKELGETATKEIKKTKESPLSLGVSMGYVYNTYAGGGLEFGMSPSYSISKKGESKGSLGLGLDVSGSSSSGFSMSPTANYSRSTSDAEELSAITGNIGISMNSRQGLGQLSLGVRPVFSTSDVNKATTKVYNNKTGKLLNRSGSFSMQMGAGFFDFNSGATVFPKTQYPMVSSGFTFKGALGTEIKGSDVQFDVSGYHSIQDFAETELEYVAYGYDYLENHGGAENYLLDFNREKDGVMSEVMPYLPVTHLTYDLYTASANGFSTSFRPHRADVGTVSDAKVTSVSDNTSTGVNYSMVDLVKGGLDVNSVDVNSVTEKWVNDATRKFTFKKVEDVSENHYKPYYFRSAGEMTPIDDDRLALFNHDKPIRVALTGDKNNVDVDAKLVSDNEDASYSQSITQEMEYESQRPENAINIKGLTAYEASMYGFNRFIENHDESGNFARIPRMGKEGDLIRQPHHLSEFTVTNTGGMQYVYGVPTYNVKQKEVTFAVDNEVTSCDQLVSYTPGTDNTVNNSKGKDNFFQSQETPSYASSFLLTSVLSPDYEDLTGNGISDDDHGTAVKFNYEQEDFNTSSFYRWRTPFEEDKASYNNALRADGSDQKASYIYGEREVWYLRSLESKNFVARFHLGDRLDGYGVKGENGGLDNDQKLSYLKSIELFSKEEFKAAEAESRTAIPIKTVHFQYNYELCGDVPNNNGNTLMEDVDGDGTPENINAAKGKLTLKRIWFTYGASTLGEESSYHFTYNGTGIDYDPKKVDRWGTYTSNGPASDCYGDTKFPKNEFPYSNQDQTDADVDAAVWSLSEIKLPSGGLMKVTYEADDYAYVQNKRALRMFGVQDVRSDRTTASGNTNLEFYDDEKENANFLIFNLDESLDGTLSQTDADEQFSQDYDVAPGSKLLTRILFNLRDHDDFTGKEEYINGYGEVKSAGVQKSSPTGDYDQGYVELVEVAINDRDRKDNDGNLKHPINPLVKNALAFIQDYLPGIANPGSEPKTTDQSAIRGLANSYFKEIPKMAIGANRVMRNDNYARSAIKAKSMIRLADPDKKKLGGGLRVKQIMVYDNWKAMTSQTSDLYEGVTGQIYDYTMKEGDANISSGVAANEPGMGSEENALRYWLEEKELDKKGVANDILMYETPYGNAFLPGPSVGYRNVTVRAYNPTTDDPNWVQSETIKATATGYSVNEFFTTYEFPSIWTTTDIDAKPWTPLFTPGFLSVSFINKLWVTQGHCFVVNDMNGKPKAKYVYGEGVDEFDSEGNRNKATASTEYIYNANKDDGTIDSYLRTVDADVSSDYTLVNSEPKYADPLGYTMDVVFDAMYSSSETRTGKIQGNLDAFLIGVPPGAFPMVWYTKSSSDVKSWYIGCTKVIRQQGILLKTITKTNGIAEETGTTAYDRNSGAPIESKGINEFDEDRYEFTYPAHWYYTNLANKSVRQDHYFENVSLSASPDFDLQQNAIAISGLKDGDQVVLYEVKTETLTKGVYPLTYLNYKEQHKTDKTRRLLQFDAVDKWRSPILWYSGGKLIDRAGNLIDDLGSLLQVDLKIVNPVEENNTVATIGTVVTLGDELYDLNGVYNTTADVLTAGAVEYSDDWRTQCCGFKVTSNNDVIVNISPCGDGVCDIVNPYVKGIKAQWRPKKNWFVVSDRSSSIRTSGEADIANDGVLTDFNAFWTYSGGNWQMITNPGIANHWDWATEITEYNIYGVEIENTNKLNIPSSALYGYNGHLPIAVATNAEYSEIAFDGFEDYNYQRPLTGSFGIEWVKTLGHKQCYYPQHFGFTSLLHDDLESDMDPAKSHTGIRSLKVQNGDPQIQEYTTQASIQANPDVVPFVVDEEDCYTNFKPKADKSYTLSCWAKMATTSFAYTAPSVEVIFLDAGSATLGTATLSTDGPVVDGWQRIFGHFDIPATCAKIQVKYNNSDPLNAAFFDDMRIYPKDAVITTYVYHPDNLRLMAKMDENNYAALYEYDGEGNLVRTKKETERGIVTLQENRTHIQKSVQ